MLEPPRSCKTCEWRASPERVAKVLESFDRLMARVLDDDWKYHRAMVAEDAMPPERPKKDPDLPSRPRWFKSVKPRRSKRKRR